MSEFRAQASRGASALRWVNKAFGCSTCSAHDPTELVKRYCEAIIDPLELDKDDSIVLVDFSMTGDGVYQV